MRVLNWPERFAEAVAEAEDKRFGDGYFCATFAADCVQAITGVDCMEAWRDLSLEDARAAVCAAHGSVEGYLSELFGAPVPTAFAQRGDVIIRENDDGLALGICLGIYSAFAADEGLALERTLDCKEAYRVL